MPSVTWYLTPMTRTNTNQENWVLNTGATQEYRVFFGTQTEFDALSPTAQASFGIVVIDTNGDDRVGSAELRAALANSTAPTPSDNSGYLGTSDVNYDGHGLEATGAYSTSNKGMTSTPTAVLISLHRPTETNITAEPGFKGGIGNFDPFFPGTLDDNPICFVSGTMIDTDTGPRAVETLVPGDLIVSVDRGAIPLRLSLYSDVTATILKRHPELRPIRISAGALGCGLPDRDLLVSPQHRILIRSRIAQRMFDTDEVLVAAKQLLQLDRIDIAADLDEFRYYHLVFDQHEVIRSNGALSESLYPGPEALRSVGPAARREIYTLFPHLRDIDPSAVIAARMLASGRQARKLANRHLQNRKPLLS